MTPPGCSRAIETGTRARKCDRIVHVGTLRSERIILILILVAYTALAAYYAVTVPLFEAPEEVAHFFYAKHLVDTHTLPVQDPRGPNLWAETGSQPPLYYVLVALVIAPVDTHRATDYLWRNPYVNLKSPRVPGNKNYFVHTERECWPYRDLPLAVHLARGLSIVLGVLSILATYALARALFPHHPNLALAAAATLAFIPQFIFVTSTVTGDALAIFTGTLALWTMVRGPRPGGEVKHAALLGLVVALVALSKMGGLLFLLPGIVAAWMAGREDRKRAVLNVGVFAVVFAAAAGWWYVRNLLLYGDPLGLSTLFPYAHYAPPPLTIPALKREALWFLQSFWALFGWYNVPIGPRAYFLLHGVELVILAGLILGLVRRRSGHSPAWGLLVGTLALATVPALAARGLGFVPLPQARHAFPALAAAAVLMAWGWYHAVPRAARAYWAGVLPLGLFVLAAVVPGRWIAPVYTPPPRVRPAAIPERARPVNMVFDHRIRLWAVDIPQITTHPGDAIDVTLYMGKVGDLPVDYTLRIRLLGRQGEEVGRLDSMTGWGTYPTRLWRAGEVVVDHYRVRVSTRARIPTLLRVEVGFFNHWNGRTLPVTTVDGVPVTGQVKTLRLVAARPVLPRPRTATYASFGREIALVGADPPPPQVHRGESITFRLYWQALRPARASYTIFTHLVRVGDPHPVAQHDKRPLDGDYPTVAWAPGEVVVDTYHIRVPADIPPGTYMVVTGLYQLETLQRLPLVEGPTRPWLTDAAVVAVVDVQ